MKEILEAIDSRIRNPLFGYFVIALFALNWQSIFYLVVDDGSTSSRISYFQNNTNIYSLIYYPVIIAGLYSLFYPWINYSFMFLCRKPTELKNTLQAESEHKLLVKKQQLEDLRSKMLSSAENELIERAKRDGKIAEIENEAIREKLKIELEQLRRERDELRNTTRSKPDYDEYKKLMELADGLKDRARNSNNPNDGSTYLDQARELENRAQQIVILKPTTS